MAARRKRIAPTRLPLFLVPKNPQVLQEYASWYTSRGAQVPHIGEDMLFVADQRGLLCGVSLYPTSGPWVLVEYLATNPAAPVRLRYRAVLALANGVRAYCVARGRSPVMVLRHRGLMRLLMRAGFVHQPGVVLSADCVMEAR